MMMDSLHGAQKGLTDGPTDEQDAFNGENGQTPRVNIFILVKH